MVSQRASQQICTLPLSLFTVCTHHSFAITQQFHILPKDLHLKEMLQEVNKAIEQWFFCYHIDEAPSLYRRWIARAQVGHTFIDKVPRHASQHA